MNIKKIEIPELKIQNPINEMLSIISKILEKKKFYDDLEKEYCKCRIKYDSCNSELKRLYPREFFDYQCFSYSRSYWQNHELTPEFDNLLLEINVAYAGILELSHQLSVAKNEYKNNTLLQFYLEKLDSEVLNAIIEYLDINITLEKSDIDKTQIIKNSIMNDFELLEELHLQLPENKPYRGTISIMEALIDEKDRCETKIEKYNGCEEKLKILYKKYEDTYELVKEKETRKNELESTFINKFLKHEELQELKFDLKSLCLSLQNLLTEFDLYVNKFHILLNEKSDIYLKNINLNSFLDLIINRLGEKSLKELIVKLSIIVPETEDNYFNETEEIKKLLKNWFCEFEEKLKNERKLEEAKCESTSKWSEIDVLSVINSFNKNEKHLIKK